LLYIGFSQKYIENNYESGIVKFNSVIETRDSDAVDSIEQLVLQHLEQKAVCDKYNAAFFEIIENYLDEMNEIYKWIDLEISKLV
jgi:putative acetyltransferase